MKLSVVIGGCSFNNTMDLQTMRENYLLLMLSIL